MKMLLIESLAALAAIVLSHCSVSTCHLAYWRGVLVIPYSMVGCILGNQLSCRPLNIRREIDLEIFGIISTCSGRHSLQVV